MTIATRKPNKSPRRVARKTAVRKSLHVVLDSRQMLKRIDAMMNELTLMRQQIAPAVPAVQSNIVDQLFGALGHGTWEEYDLDLDWKRFGEWNLR